MFPVDEILLNEISDIVNDCNDMENIYKSFRSILISHLFTKSNPRQKTNYDDIPEFIDDHSYNWDIIDTTRVDYLLYEYDSSAGYRIYLDYDKYEQLHGDDEDSYCEWSYGYNK
jgi:spermidine synthase